MVAAGVAATEVSDLSAAAETTVVGVLGHPRAAGPPLPGPAGGAVPPVPLPLGRAGLADPGAQTHLGRVGPLALLPLPPRLLSPLLFPVLS